MPTYAFTTARPLTAAQRGALVESVTAIHAVEATAPRYFVQVVFHRVEPGSIFIGGEPASPDHVWVRADIRSGRTPAQKSKMLRKGPPPAPPAPSRAATMASMAAWPVPVTAPSP